MKQYFLYSEGGGFNEKVIDDLFAEIKEILCKLPQKVDLDIEAFVIDLFCGFGGTSWGYEETVINGKKTVKVVFCVNHDKLAILSHILNHPDAVHAIEDIRTMDLTALRLVVDHYRIIYPNAKVILWASLECTNFSKAKGGLSRDPDSRTLAHHLFRYIDVVNPDYIMIENVVEFMSWGPVKIKAQKQVKEDLSKGVYAHTELKIGRDKKTKEECYWWEPISKLNGTYWNDWKERIKRIGYKDNWRKLNCADYGVAQTRDRLFGCFAKPELPIVWPEPTHAKSPKPSLFNNLEPWVGVKTVLDLNNVGESIFNRDLNINLRKQDRKPLCTNTMKRYFEGCVKIIAGGKANYEVLKKSFYEAQETQFVAHYYGTGGQYRSVHDPNGCVPTKDRFSLFTAHKFIDEAFSGSTGKTIDQPSGALLGTPKQYVLTLQPVIINTNFNNNGSSVDEPSPTVMACRKHHYILNPSHGGHVTDIERPSPVVIARQDKAPLYLITAITGSFQIPVYDTDCQWTIKIKEFMSVMGFSDISMRMFEIPELLQIQSFPSNFKMAGSKSQRKKFIGNAVPPKIVTSMSVKYVKTWREQRKIAA